MMSCSAPTTRSTGPETSWAVVIPLDGLLDEVLIYSRALDAAEIGLLATAP